MKHSSEEPNFRNERIFPPEQTTLQNIVDRVAELTKGQFDFGPDHDSLRARVHEPYSTEQTGIVHSYKTDDDGQYPGNKLVSIHLTEKASLFGDKIHTNYTIIETPDGDLFIDKNLRTSNQTESNKTPASNDEVAVEALKLMVQATREDKAEKVHNAMGINFVDQEEAAALLEKIETLEPFDDFEMDKKTAGWIARLGPRLR